MHAGFSYADPNAGVHGAFALLTALYHRAENRRRAIHRHEPVGMRDGAAPEGIMEYTMNGREPVRDGNRDPKFAPHGKFQCKDRFENTGVMIDRWVSIVAADDAEFGRLAAAIGRPELASDPRFATPPRANKTKTNSRRRSPRGPRSAAPPRRNKSSRRLASPPRYARPTSSSRKIRISKNAAIGFTSTIRKSVRSSIAESHGR